MCARVIAVALLLAGLIDLRSGLAQLIEAGVAPAAKPGHGFEWFFANMRRPEGACAGEHVVATWYDTGHLTASGEVFNRNPSPQMCSLPWRLLRRNSPLHPKVIGTFRLARSGILITLTSSLLPSKRPVTPSNLFRAKPRAPSFFRYASAAMRRVQPAIRWPNNSKKSSIVLRWSFPNSRGCLRIVATPSPTGAAFCAVK